MKKWLAGIGTALLTTALSVIVTSLLSGQSLAGLVKLKGLSQTILRSSVPAWVFALVLSLALLGAVYFARHSSKRYKGKIHFVPDANNCGWASRGSSPMDLRVSGWFTYDGLGTLVVLKARLKGTSLIGDLLASVISPDGSGRLIPVTELLFEQNASARVLMDLRLTPVLGIEGKPFRGQLILRDRYNRDFFLDPVDFPWIGARR